MPTKKTDDWKPVYERWRHGGWYVKNVRYPSGAIGCVSNNYPDKQWRIICGRPNDETFPSRDAAARAEREIAANTPIDTLKALKDLYTFVFNEVESFEDENVGADLAYLMGAILCDDKCDWYSDRYIVRVLNEGRERSAVSYALDHINILPEG